MTGSALLKHSWGMFWRNKMDAARISIVLLILSLMVTMTISFATTMSPGVALSSGPVGIILLQVLEQVLTDSHRSLVGCGLAPLFVAV